MGKVDAQARSTKSMRHDREAMPQPTGQWVASIKLTLKSLKGLERSELGKEVEGCLTGLVVPKTLASVVDAGHFQQRDG